MFKIEKGESHDSFLLAPTYDYQKAFRSADRKLLGKFGNFFRFRTIAGRIVRSCDKTKPCAAVNLFEQFVEIKREVAFERAAAGFKAVDLCLDGIDAETWFKTGNGMFAWLAKNAHQKVNDFIRTVAYGNFGLVNLVSFGESLAQTRIARLRITESIRGCSGNYLLHQR